ncbi:MAG: N-acetylmuramoyl-L-alanine amidase [Longimicrobiaceae bacterium]
MKTKGQFILFETLAELAHFLEKPIQRKVSKIQNHHTLIPSYEDFTGSNHFARLEAIKAAHLERGFSDIGENLTTFPDGTVAVCRSFELDPACAKGANTGSVCIENLGNFDKGRDVMTAAQRDCIVQVNALLCHRFKLAVNTESILYHHWFDLKTGKRTDGAGITKSCPGTNFFGGNTVADCKANFLPLVSAALAAIEAPPVPVASVASPDGVLAVRSGPRATAAKVGSLPNGTVVHIHEAKGIWRRLDPVEARWVSSRFLVAG